MLVKGADWAEDAIVGRDIVEARGGAVVRVPIEGSYSTSEIVRRIRGNGEGGNGDAGNGEGGRER